MRLHLTIASLLVAAAAGAANYRISFETQVLQRELKQLNRAHHENEVALHVLDAEWSAMNSPGRLAALAQRHLGFGPLGTDSIVNLEALPSVRPGETMFAADLRLPRPKPQAPMLAARPAPSSVRPFEQLAAALAGNDPGLSGLSR